jgi:hypothetical protein
VSEDFRESSLLEVGWKDYRGWAEASRALQRASRHQSIWALVIASGAALFGALASIHWPTDGIVVVAASLIAASLAGIGAILGRYILDCNAQQRWIQARATAESIKSECYRYAARCGEYGLKDAALRFKNRIDALAAAAVAKGAVADAQARVAAGPGPKMGMTADWYQANRLLEQRKWYETRSGQHASKAGLLRRTGFILGSVTAALGAVSAAHLVDWVAPLIAMMTTITTSIAAYGALSRHTYLAASYSAMASQIDKLVALHKDGVLPDDKLVESGEDLLSSEHRAWADRVAQNRPEARQRSPGRRAAAPAPR